VRLTSIPARLRRLAAGTVVVVGLGATLSACGNSGTVLAKQACSHVDRSLSLLTQAAHQSDPATAARLQQQAYNQLRQALPIAAEAAYHDGQWQALMTTVSESNRVPEATLVDALRAQCQQADSSIFGQPPPPSSIPPPAPVSSSP
jgi:hypothetical protein